MERIAELETSLRDSILVALSIEYEYHTARSSQANSIRLKFVRLDREIIELHLINVRHTDIVDDYSGVCVSHIKAFSTEEGVLLSLDPFDERVPHIDERDNFIFAAKAYCLDVSSY